MDISLFQLLIAKLGALGFTLGMLCFVVMMMGSVIDILQFWWVVRRLAKKRERLKYDRIRAQVLLEIHEKKE